MDGNRSSGRVTSSTGDVAADGEIIGYRGTGTMIDPGPYREREGLESRIAVATCGPPELVAAQIAGVRRMLRREAVAA